MGEWHWRDTMRIIRFFGLDARAVLPFCVLIVYLRPVSLAICLLSTVAFVYLEKKGFTVPSAMRAFRVWIIGKKRPAVLSIHKRKFNDYG